MPKGMAPTVLRECLCARIGYALLLCEEHAPIPFQLTDRGRRDARRMKQWDAIFDTLVERQAASPGSERARKAWATRRANGRTRS